LSAVLSWARAWSASGAPRPV